MEFKDISTLIALILAVSLASERLVTMLKTLMPEWLADEKKTSTQEVDLVADRWRRFVVIIMAFLAAWLTATFLTKGYAPLGEVVIEGQGHINTLLLGLLASGGSAFWSSILGYSKAVKDIKVQTRAKENLQFHEEVKSLGLNGDMAAQLKGQHAFQNPVLDKIHALTPPEFQDTDVILKNSRI
jgi:hypothetical protein